MVVDVTVAVVSDAVERGWTEHDGDGPVEAEGVAAFSKVHFQN